MLTTLHFRESPCVRASKCVVCLHTWKFCRARHRPKKKRISPWNVAWGTWVGSTYSFWRVKFQGNTCCELLNIHYSIHNLHLLGKTTIGKYLTVMRFDQEENERSPKYACQCVIIGTRMISALFSTSWVDGKNNQLALLNLFAVMLWRMDKNAWTVFVSLLTHQLKALLAWRLA